jgi:hypothetical protein
LVAASGVVAALGALVVAVSGPVVPFQSRVEVSPLPSAALNAYIDALASYDTGVLPHLRHAIRQRAALDAIGGIGRRSVLLFGNLQGYVEPCFCGQEAATGGLIALVGGVLEWRRAVDPECLVVEVGNSLLTPTPLPQGLRDLIPERLSVLALAYRATGARVFCPNARDLSAFPDLAAFEEWSGAAGVTPVVSNSATVLSSVQRVYLHDDLALMSFVSPPSSRPWMHLSNIRDSVRDAFLKPIPASITLLVFHGVPPNDLSDALGHVPPDVRQRMVVIPVTDGATDIPSWQLRLGSPHVVQPEGRGRSIEALQFRITAPNRRNGSLLDVDPHVLSLEASRQARRAFRPPPIDQFAVPIGHTSLTLPPSNRRSDDDIAAAVRALAAYDALVLRRLMNQPAFEAHELPQAITALTPAACGKCHPKETAAYMAHDPHRASADAVVNATSRLPAVECMACHMTGLRRETADTAPAQARDVFRARRFITGVTCVTCHVDARRERGGAHAPVDASAALSLCVSCHDSVNSPQFDRKSYCTHLACCNPKE